jgi:peptidyl-prolyl cis-trans isomerase C
MALSVNGEGISLVEFEQEMKRFEAGLVDAGVSVPGVDESKQIVQDELINQLLLKQGAVENGFSISSEDLQARIEELTQKSGGADSLSQWMETNFFTDEIFKKAFERAIYSTWMRDQITDKVAETAEQVHVRQIRVLDEGEARGILSNLQSGSDFATIAGLYDPVTHGDLGWFPRGYLTQPAIDEAAFTLEPGGISEVIKTDIGYHIIQVIERDDQHKLAPDAYQHQKQQAIISWLNEKRAVSEVVITP